MICVLVANDRGMTTYVPVHEPAAAATLFNAPIGSTHDVVLRGTPGYNQPEVGITAVVAAAEMTDFGKTVRLDAGSTQIAVTERPPLPIHPKFWKGLGLNPRKADALVQKNFFHYRMFYAGTSFRNVPIVSSGATSLEAVRTRDYGRPMHPQMQLNDWRPTHASAA